MKEQVFFDFDGTLVKFDSFVRFGRYSLPWYSFVKGLVLSIPWLTWWKLGLCSSSKAKEHLFSYWFKGLDIINFRHKCESFADEIDRNLNAKVISELLRHKKMGREIIIISASISNWIIPWASRHSIETVIATEADVSPDGIITGKFATPNCLGEEKIRRIALLYPHFKRENSWAYSDSESDRPLLQYVTHGFTVRKGQIIK